jgi:hypothetical protein
MFSISQNLCSKQGYDMIRYDFPRFILEVGVVDAEVGVEPPHLVGDEFAWDKPLWDYYYQEQSATYPSKRL